MITGQAPQCARRPPRSKESSNLFVEARYERYAVTGTRRGPLPGTFGTVTVSVPFS
jgi:hypothetical protein